MGIKYFGTWRFQLLFWFTAVIGFQKQIRFLNSRRFSIKSTHIKNDPQVKPHRPSIYTKPEVLSPAGGWPQLRAAVCNGADAVYFGLQEGFNARARASNFPVDSLLEVKFSRNFMKRMLFNIRSLFPPLRL